MTLKHTPGPWAVVTGINDRWLKTGVNADGEPCHILINDDMSLDSLADARLISAAPELLAALQYVTDMLSSSIAPDDYEPFRKCVSQARAAISKATGE